MQFFNINVFLILCLEACNNFTIEDCYCMSTNYKHCFCHWTNSTIVSEMFIKVTWNPLC